MILQTKMHLLKTTQLSSGTFRLKHTAQYLKCLSVLPHSYGGRRIVTMLPGCGNGPEIMKHVRDVFRIASIPVDFEVINECDGEAEIKSILRNGVAIKGNIPEEDQSQGIPINVSIRNKLDLYIDLLHFISYPFIKTRHDGINIILVRQNTEGEYAMLEHESVPGVVESLKIVTRSNTERLARYAFEYAKKHNRKKITTVHKANIIKFSDGLFLETARKMSKEYTDIKHDDMIIDNFCMQLVSKPKQFDMVLTMNQYGSIISRIVCGLTGGTGFIPGRNFGDNYVVFEPGMRASGMALIHRNLASPITMFAAAADMLDHIGMEKHAEHLRIAIDETITKHNVRTKDMGGEATKEEVIEKISSYYTP